MLSKGVQYMLLATFFFSLMQVAVKFLPHIPAHEIILFRSGISLIVTLGYLRYYHISPWGNNKKYLLMRGVFGVIALSLFFITLQNIPLASAVTIQYLSPIFTTIFAIFILKEKIRPRLWVFFAVSFSGVYLLKGFDERIDWEYLLIGVLSAVFSGLAYNCIRKLRFTDHPWVVVLYFPFIATPVMAVLCLYEWVQPQSWDWFWLISTGIFTQFGQVFMTKALQNERAYKISSLKYLGTIYALFFGYFLFDETYTLLSFMGILLILLGVVFTTSVKQEE